MGVIHVKLLYTSQTTRDLVLSQPFLAVSGQITPWSDPSHSNHSNKKVKPYHISVCKREQTDSFISVMKTDFLIAFGGNDLSGSYLNMEQSGHNSF